MDDEIGSRPPSGILASSAVTQSNILNSLLDEVERTALVRVPPQLRPPGDHSKCVPKMHIPRTLCNNATSTLESRLSISGDSVPKYSPAGDEWDSMPDYSQFAGESDDADYPCMPDYSQFAGESDDPVEHRPVEHRPVEHRPQGGPMSGRSFCCPRGQSLHIYISGDTLVCDKCAPRYAPHGDAFELVD